MKTKSKTESNPNLRLKNKLLKGVKNPVNDIEEKVAHQMNQKKIVNPDRLNGANLKNSPKKNFDKLYGAMYQGNNKHETSHLNDFKAEYGVGHKDMSGSQAIRNDPIKKTETKMGNH